MAASKPMEAVVVAAAAPSSGSGVGGGGATAGPGTGGLPRWQLALAVGAPLLLGAGAMYLWSRQRRRREAGGRGDAGGLKRNSERKTPEGRASPAPGSGHPDGPGAHLELNSLDRAQAAKNKGNKYKTVINMVGINSIILIITLNINELNTIIFRVYQKTRPNYMLFARNPF